MALGLCVGLFVATALGRGVGASEGKALGRGVGAVGSGVGAAVGSHIAYPSTAFVCDITSDPVAHFA